MNPSVDKYLIDGCMRCAYGATPQCKVNNWRVELELLRHIALECGLIEDLKWGVPCYTIDDKNIIMISAFKEYCSLSFFKGALLNDTHNILQKQGENSQVALIIKFTNPLKITEQKEILKSYILQAIEIEKTGQKVESKKNREPVPDELLHKFEELPELQKAFYALTPGKQRGYIIYFSQPKQPQSKINRIEKCIPMILDGKGLHDKYST
jgi:uncharacterized protein YdeI (YjbR/CyaY-like superfamily)